MNPTPRDRQDTTRPFAEEAMALLAANLPASYLHDLRKDKPTGRGVKLHAAVTAALKRAYHLGLARRPVPGEEAS